MLSAMLPAGASYFYYVMLVGCRSVPQLRTPEAQAKPEIDHDTFTDRILILI